MTKLYLVRHGETDYNLNKKLCGWSDPGLNDRGREQALSLSKALQNLEFDVIYNSGLKRAVETTEIIMENNKSVIYSLDFLKEIHFGRFEGFCMNEIKEKHPQIFKQLQKDYVGFCFPEGESLRDMYNRVASGIEELLKTNDKKNILLVSHSGVIRNIIAHLITGDINKHWNFKIDHCSLSIIEATENFNILVKLNEVK
ncbi:histidine phosphatase family protein [Alkaliphilus pronyensis]|uniref:Histidine phosphatase family protein n=1 Tax=Alkaliphilus pronyensis TaxID=1482732 RepID=A0A6I0F7J3_9FIRM|nr:histidine phosphatase family protein [Alkaliphilus pronyensis]KAB3532896.1 histidine phosphatase family protein [Alkaliphilus pronyensis]